MTTITGSIYGTNNTFDSAALEDFASGTLSNQSSTQFTVSTGQYYFIAYGTNIQYSGGHPSSGTVTSFDLGSFVGYASHFTGFSVSVSSAWNAMSHGDVTSFYNLFFGGNDTFNMQNSNGTDFLTGAAGNDTFNYSNNFTDATQIDGGTGTDILNLAGQSSFETLNNVKNVETINLAAGFDYSFNISPANAIKIDGSTLHADDTLNVSEVWYQTTALTVLGGAGADIFASGRGNDTFNGGGGFDMISYVNATSGVTVNLGLSTAQAVGGGAGSDTLISVESITGSPYNDTLTGSSGDDTFFYSAGTDTIDGGAGNDTFSFQNASFAWDAPGVTIDLRSGGAHLGNVTLTSVENVVGSSKGDTFYSNSQNNVFTGGGGFDVINYQDATSGMTFNMTVYSPPAYTFDNTIVATGGGEGTDTLINFSEIIGTNYDDTFYLPGPISDIYSAARLDIYGGDGTDTVSFQNASAAISEGLSYNSTLHDVENLTGTAFNDQLTGDTGDNVLNGGAGNDVIKGSYYGSVGDGADTINGGDGDDTIFGCDTQSGSDGDDILNGGKGNDTIHGDSYPQSSTDGTDLLDGGAGNDMLFGDYISDTATYQDAMGGVTVDLSNTNAQAVGGGMGSDTLQGIERLVGSNFNDTLSGNSSDNTLNGSGGVDTVSYANASGGVTVDLSVSGAQTIGGGQGKDTLISIENLVGSHSGDTLAGDSGNNFLTGGGGNDAISGGGGTDTAVFSGSHSDYAITTAGDAGTVIDLRSGSPEGTDTLSGMEYLKFSDGTFAMSDFVGPALSGAGNTASYTEQSAAAAIDGALGIAYAANTTLTGATVTISNGYAAGDTLNFTDQTGITGSYNSGTHVLTLSGTASVASYQAALRSVTFSSSSDDPTLGGSDASRTISFTVNDGATSSSTVTSTINVTAVNDPAVAHNDAVAIGESGAVGTGLNLFADNGSGVDSDPDGPAVHISAVNGSGANLGTQITLASGALLTVNADGTFGYNSNHAFDYLAGPGSGATDTVATDTFTYTLAGGGTGTATVTITGVDSNDTLQGTGGNDTLNPGIGNDTVLAGGGNDAINFGSKFTSADSVDGGAGADTVYLSGNYSGGVTFGAATMINVETITLGAGFDYNLTTDDATVVAGQSLTVDGSALGSGDVLTFNGAAETNGTFTVTGGAAADTITGGTGNDVLGGGDGNDMLHLENGGNDTATGGNGNDKIYLGGALTAADSINAGAGTDTVFLDGDYSAGVTFGAATLINAESLSVAAGHDYKLTTHNATVAVNQVFNVDGSALGAGNTLVFNGAAETDGRFVIDGGAGNDTLTGGASNDIFHLASGGTDTVVGGAGNDKAYLGDTLTASDKINGGNDIDYVYLDGDYSGGVVFGATTMVNVEHLIVTAGHSYNLTTDNATVAANQLFYVDGSGLGAGDALTFNGAADTNGRFVITGGAGNDTLSSGAGNDLLHLELGGDDTASAGAGNDKIYLGGALTAADSVNAGGGIDYVYLDGDYSAGVVFGASTLTNVENLTLMAGNDYNLTLDDGTVASGQTLYVDAALGAANSLIFDATAEVNGRFVITSGAGNDTLIAGGGADIFHLESGGNDNAAGGDGNDKFYFGGTFTAADSVDGGAGTDYIYLDGNYSGGVVFGAATMVNVEHLVLSAGHNYTLTTNDANVASGELFSVDGSALGGGNALNFNGAAELNGRFSLTGGAGADTLAGGTGNDFITGAHGNDTLTGGGGNDRFTFSHGDGNDTITDFTAGNAGGDVIALQNYGIANFAALQSHMAQSGADTIITFDGSNHITLHDVTMTSLNAGDFVFS